MHKNKGKRGSGLENTRVGSYEADISGRMKLAKDAVETSSSV